MWYEQRFLGCGPFPVVFLIYRVAYGPDMVFDLSQDSRDYSRTVIATAILRSFAILRSCFKLCCRFFCIQLVVGFCTVYEGLNFGWHQPFLAPFGGFHKYFGLFIIDSNAHLVVHNFEVFSSQDAVK